MLHINSIFKPSKSAPVVPGSLCSVAFASPDVWINLEKIFKPFGPSETRSSSRRQTKMVLPLFCVVSSLFTLQTNNKKTRLQIKCFSEALPRLLFLCFCVLPMNTSERHKVRAGLLLLSAIKISCVLLLFDAAPTHIKNFLISIWWISRHVKFPPREVFIKWLFLFRSELLIFNSTSAVIYRNTNGKVSFENFREWLFGAFIAMTRIDSNLRDSSEVLKRTARTRSDDDFSLKKLSKQPKLTNKKSFSGARWEKCPATHIKNVTALITTNAQVAFSGGWERLKICFWKTQRSVLWIFN